MKIFEIRDAYYQASGKVSEIVRQLSLAGIAVIWVFRIGGENSGGVRYTSDSLWALGLLVAALGADLMQYVYNTLLWGWLNRRYWKKYKNNERDVDVSEWVNWATLLLFWIKVIFALVAYGLLVHSIIDQLKRIDQVKKNVLACVNHLNYDPDRSEVADASSDLYSRIRTRCSTASGTLRFRQGLLGSSPSS